MVRVLVYSRVRGEDYLDGLTRAAAGTGLEARRAGTEEEAASLAGWADVFFGAGLSPAVLLSMPGLRFIQWIWAGVDVPLSHPEFARALVEGRFRMARAVGVFDRSIAEYVMAFAYHVTKDIPGLMRAQARQAWDRRPVEGLAGKVMGVVGFGSVGSAIARLASASGLEVWGLRRTGSAGGRASPAVRMFGPEGLPDLVAGVDFLVLALPLTASTKGLMTGDLFRLMKPTSVLINVGRGAVIDEGDLVSALKAGRPGWAVLDVFETEPLPGASELWTIPNVVVTPHIAALSQPHDLVPLLLRNLENFRAGRPLEGEVRGDLGY
ncbi:MAG: D-2-hydroxyacid dehydrogenase [Bacillota bacterium]|nr:MAG: D-2-hydroxyacid dehydrogenase [Bacillota bacterium]